MTVQTYEIRDFPGGDKSFVEIPFDVGDDIERIEVSYTFPAGSGGAVIDIGLARNGQSRGWTGSEYGHIWVAEGRASPGYRTGALPGQWHVVLGIVKVGPDPWVDLSIRRSAKRLCGWRANCIAIPNIRAAPSWAPRKSRSVRDILAAVRGGRNVVCFAPDEAMVVPSGGSAMFGTVSGDDRVGVRFSGLAQGDIIKVVTEKGVVDQISAVVGEQEIDVPLGERFAAIKALHAHGVRVPDDISVMGFDGVALGGLHAPPLTTISVPLDQFGAEALRLLEQRKIMQRDQRAAHRLELGCTIVERKSVSRPKKR